MLPTYTCFALGPYISHNGPKKCNCIRMKMAKKCYSGMQYSQKISIHRLCDLRRFHFGIRLNGPNFVKIRQFQNS